MGTLVIFVRMYGKNCKEQFVKSMINKLANNNLKHCFDYKN